MSELTRPLLLVAIVLALPIVPLLVWGELFQSSLARWQETPPSRTALALGVTCILASDILLPVPSGPVTTFAGAQLGLVPGMAFAWLGMMLGAVAAFAVVRRYGAAMALRLTTQEDMDRLAAGCRRHAVAMLIATRPVPVLAEASVLLAGLGGCSWGRFLPAVAISNLVVAAIWTWLGHYARQHDWLPLAFALSLLVPLALMLGFRRRVVKQPDAD